MLLQAWLPLFRPLQSADVSVENESGTRKKCYEKEDNTFLTFFQFSFFVVAAILGQSNN